MTMDALGENFGTVSEVPDGTVTLRYERHFPRPIETVWSAITQPERIADWLGAGELEPRVGGRFAARVGPGGRVAITGRVLTWEPPSALVCTWTWPGGVETVIRYDLTATNTGATRLVFTQTGLPSDQMASVLPGWHLYLERLGQVVDDAKPEADFSARHAEIRVLYGRQYGTEAAACEPAEAVSG
jgi:uncharacterized protein YndB with AHSA1/START domain